MSEKMSVLMKARAITFDVLSKHLPNHRVNVYTDKRSFGHRFKFCVQPSAFADASVLSQVTNALVQAGVPIMRVGFRPNKSGFCKGEENLIVEISE